MEYMIFNDFFPFYDPSLHFFLEASFEVYKIWVCSMSYLSIIIIIIANLGAALKISSAQISPIQNGRGAVGVPLPSHMFLLLPLPGSLLWPHSSSEASSSVSFFLWFLRLAFSE